MNLKKLNKKKYRFFSDRLAVMAMVVCIMFLLVTYQFYKIQIIEHAQYAEELRQTVEQHVDIPAIRGTIYDRYGKPLAINKAVYVLKVDPQITLGQGVLDKVLLKVAQLLEKNGDTYIDNMPISKSAPFDYIDDEDSIRRFITNYVPYNDNKDKERLYKLSAGELIDYLKSEEIFNLSSDFSDEEVRKILAMRLEMRRTAYQKYKPVTLAQNISMETLAAVEENQNEYMSVFAEVESQRYYPYKEAFGNILGYTRTITDSQYQKLKDSGYEQDDVIGQVGIENTQESQLRGKKGSKVIQVDNVGRTVDTLEIDEATAGNGIYLSIDANLQVQIYNDLEKRLSEAIVERLKGTSSKAFPLTAHEILVSMAKNNQIDLKEMSSQEKESIERQVYDRVATSYREEVARLEEAEKNLPDEEKTNLTLKQHFANMLDSKPAQITDRELVLIMVKQGTLKVSESQRSAVLSGNYNIEGLLITLFESGDLKPDQMDVTPSSGTAVVVEPNTGQTLALVSYPSYDNNQFIQNFNSYYKKLHDGVDTRNIEINRALKTAKAPGSTFKMVTAIAGLEEGVVDTGTLINDVGVYTKAGTPGPHCWIYDNSGHGHGMVNVERGLEVSCNYYFYDVVYRLGLKYGNPYGGINMLTKYVEMLGLGNKTGIQLEEASPNISSPTSLVDIWSLRAINNLRSLSGESKEKLKTDITAYLDKGFYTMGDNNATDVNGQIDYLSRSYIKPLIDTDLGITLSDNFNTIYDKVLGDFNEELKNDNSAAATQIAELVMKGDSNVPLKARTEEALATYLQGVVQSGTRKTILKAINKMPEGLLESAFSEGYKQTLALYEGQADKKEVCAELKKRIAALDNHSFDYQTIMVDKVINRIVTVYLNEYFKNVELQWKTGINIRTGIGQGDNAFTPVQMARYISAIANGKTVYNLTVINGIKDNKDTGRYIPHEPEVFNTLNLNPEYISVIHSGMHDVVAGSEGTARTYFQNFDIKLAAKTGTAQDNAGEISWFVGFAPYDSENPEVAVVTSMYGTDGLGSYNTNFAKDVFELYFKVNQTNDKVTLNNQFVP